MTETRVLEPSKRIIELFEAAKASLRRAEGMTACAIAWGIVNNFDKVYGLRDDYAHEVLNSEGRRQ